MYRKPIGEGLQQGFPDRRASAYFRSGGAAPRPGLAHKSPALGDGAQARRRDGAVRSLFTAADASGRVVRANAAAKAMLDEGSGIILDKEGREPCAHDGDLFHALQFRQASSDLAHDARNGRWRDHAPLGDGRYC